jgi:hypothetical protein
MGWYGQIHGIVPVLMELTLMDEGLSSGEAPLKLEVGLIVAVEVA